MFSGPIGNIFVFHSSRKTKCCHPLGSVKKGGTCTPVHDMWPFESLLWQSCFSGTVVTIYNLKLPRAKYVFFDHSNLIWYMYNFYLLDNFQFCKKYLWHVQVRCHNYESFTIRSSSQKWDFFVLLNFLPVSFVKLHTCILKINENATLVFSISFHYGLANQNFIFITQLFFTYSISNLFFVLIYFQYELFTCFCLKTTYLTLCNVSHEWFLFFIVLP